MTSVKALEATTTPEAFVLDQNFVMRYRGRIDLFSPDCKLVLSTSRDKTARLWHFPK
jgi:hypothetical protein